MPKARTSAQVAAQKKAALASAAKRRKRGGAQQPVSVPRGKPRGGASLANSVKKLGLEIDRGNRARFLSHDKLQTLTKKVNKADDFKHALKGTKRRKRKV